MTASNSQKFAALLAGNRGRIVAAVTSFAAWAITQLVTSKGLELPGELAISISTTAGALAGWAVDNAGARINAAGVAAIQDALPGVKTDGAALANGQTVAAVAALAGTTDAAPLPVKSAILNEVAEIKTVLHALFAVNPAILDAIRKTMPLVEKDLHMGDDRPA